MPYQAFTYSFTLSLLSSWISWTHKVPDEILDMQTKKVKDHDDGVDHEDQY